MSELKKIKSALISVYHKDGLDELITKLDNLGVKLYSTGGTKDFIESLHVAVTAVEELTTYPSILGGRVKTLHPKIFGGILARRENEGDIAQLTQYNIPEIDLVIVDLYPFEETVASGATDADIIEKIDIGGISLIRGAAKNFNDVVIISNQGQYNSLIELLKSGNGFTTIEDMLLRHLQHHQTTIQRFTTISPANGLTNSDKASIQQNICAMEKTHIRKVLSLAISMPCLINCLVKKYHTIIFLTLMRQSIL